jgi:hypothetical protein
MVIVGGFSKAHPCVPAQRGLDEPAPSPNPITRILFDDMAEPPRAQGAGLFASQLATHSTPPLRRTRRFEALIDSAPSVDREPHRTAIMAKLCNFKGKLQYSFLKLR